LWSKALPNGAFFHLSDCDAGYYLRHKSELGDFSFGSDAITHSYKTHLNKKMITEQIPKEVQELFDLGSTIGGYIIFPNNQVQRKHTINQARGVLRLIDDRFDLTLECIRRFYRNERSPLEETLKRYEAFFNLFESFEQYVMFFLLDDLVDEHGHVKFYLPFDDFQSPPKIQSIEDYLTYKKRVESFIKARNLRIEENFKPRIHTDSHG